MDYEIKKDRLNDVVTKFLENNYTPDWWGPEEFDFFEHNADEYGIVEFHINNKILFYYFNGSFAKQVIETTPEMTNNLNKIFGKFWIDPFVKWFEKNTNLKVNKVDLKTNY
jgi:hypothetical protein